MRNEETVLRPRRVGLLVFCFALPWIFILVISLLTYFGGNTGPSVSVYNFVWRFLFCILADAVLALCVFNVRITLLPDGKILYRQIGLALVNPEKEPTAHFQQNYGEGRWRNNKISTGSVHIPLGKKKLQLAVVNRKDIINPWEVEKAGYTQLIFRRRIYTDWQKRHSRQYLSIILKNDCRMEWVLWGFRSTEIEQLKTHIQKYNPEVKLYF